MEFKICKDCGQNLPLSAFDIHYNTNEKSLRSNCRKCRYQRYKTSFLFKDTLLLDLSSNEQKFRLAKKLLSSTKHWAKKRKLEFNLTLDDFLNIPTHCPVTGEPFILFSSDRSKSLSVDRINNSKGYIRGNILFVSYRVNHLKSDASIDELARIVQVYQQLG